MNFGSNIEADTVRPLGLVVGIDASRNRSGGAIAHLVGILSSLDPARHGISDVHLWSYDRLLNAVPDRPWLHKHTHNLLESSLAHQLFWQAFVLKKQLSDARCDVLFATDASTLCTFSPIVVLSQDILSYEPGQLASMPWGYALLRALAILFVQNMAFRRADGVIFLSHHAARTIQASCGQLRRTTIVPHGIDRRFQELLPRRTNHFEPGGTIRCLYVSPIFQYKNHLSVIEALEIVNRRGILATLTLVGGAGEPEAYRVVLKRISQANREAPRVSYVGEIPYSALPGELLNADLFVFASSCETFGITLLEAMCAGLPIACSNKSSLPEILGRGGIYFDPSDPVSIADALCRLCENPIERQNVAVKAKELSSSFTWERCSTATFSFLSNIVTTS